MNRQDDDCEWPSDWWNEWSFVHFLKTSVNPARVKYFDTFLKGQSAGCSGEMRSLLDIGCGGGFLSESFRDLGYRVTGLDPSGPSLASALAHDMLTRKQIVPKPSSPENCKKIEYIQAYGEDLPFDDDSFDVVCCCDVLEHVESRDSILAEVARVLRPGGVFLYDTINRTWLSRFLFLTLAQNGAWTRFAPLHLHDLTKFVSPTDLRAEMTRHGLIHECATGLRPAHIFRRIVPLLWSLHQVNRGRVSPGEFGRRCGFSASEDLRASYMGCASRATSSPIDVFVQVSFLESK